MIPKKIHYVWLGGRSLNTISIMMLNSWRRNLPDYEIIEWNETNLPIDELCAKNKFFKECYEKKLWAFVSDYVRLWVLYNYGGIYMDTDVEVISNFDQLLENKCFFGFEKGNEEIGEYISAGVIGSEKENSTIKNLMEYYDEKIWEENEFINTIILKKLYLENQNIFKDSVIYSREYFSPYSPYDYKKEEKKIDGENTVAIHWYNKNWNMSLKGYIFLTTKSIKNPLIKKIVSIKRIIGYLKKSHR